MTSLGFETIQFASKFTGQRADLFQLVELGKSAGFDWVSFDRHSLEETASGHGGLERLARACAESALPCRMVQSLRVTEDQGATARGIDRLVTQVEILQPDVVPIIVLAEPTAIVLDAIVGAIERLLPLQPFLRFGLEFGPVFPIDGLNRARNIIKLIGQPCVGFVVDSWHVFNGVTSWPDLVSLTAGEIAAVQLNDHGPLGGQSVHEAKNRRLLPGDGVFPLQAFMDQIRSTGYESLVSVEVVSETLRAVGPAEFLRLAYQAGMRFIAPVERSLKRAEHCAMIAECLDDPR